MTRPRQLDTMPARRRASPGRAWAPWLAATVLTLSGGLAGAHAADTGMAAPRLGTWYLVGWDTRHWRAEMLLTQHAGNRYAGLMTWRAVDGEPAGGAEPFHGEYFPATGAFRMKGEPVINPTGGIASGADYEAWSACDGQYLANGRWSGADIEDGTWVARHRADME